MELRSRNKDKGGVLPASNAKTISVKPLAEKKSIKTQEKALSKRTAEPKDRRKVKRLKITGGPQQIVASREEGFGGGDLEAGISGQLLKSLLNGSKDDLLSTLELWRDLNLKVPYDSYVELLRFVVLCSGVKINVPHSIITKKDLVDDLCKICLKAEINKRVLQIAVGCGSLDKKDQKAISSVFSKCWAHAKEKILSGGAEAQLFGKFTSILCILTTSNLRSLRRVATIACLQLTTDTSKQYSQIVGKIGMLTSSNRGPQSSQTTKLTKSKDVISNLVTIMLDAVYPKRFRDFDPGIRAACASCFGTWTHDIPSILLKKEYLEHNKWLFFDRSPAVRTACIKSLIQVYLAGKNLPKVLTFFSSIKKRLFEVLSNDTDVKIRNKVSHLLMLISGDDLLDAAEKDNLLLFIFDSNPSVRKEIGSFFVRNWRCNYLNRVYSKIRDLLPSMSQAQKDNIELISYCDYLTMSSKLMLRTNSKSTTKRVTNVDNNIKNIGGTSEEKDKDIKDYTIWFSHMCAVPSTEDLTFSQVDAIVNATKAHFTTLNVWTVADLVESNLGYEKKAPYGSRGDLLSAAHATEDQEICLLYILYSLCRVHISERVHSSRKNGVTLEYRILALAPKILNKYAFEQGIKASRTCEELIDLMRMLDFKNISAVEAEIIYVPLILCIKELLIKTRNADLIKTSANLFEALMATIYMQDSNLIGYIFSNASITEVPPSNCTTAKIASTARETFSSLMCSFVTHLQSSVGSLSSGVPSINTEMLEDLYYTLFKICKLSKVAKWLDADKHSEELKGASFTHGKNNGVLFDTAISLLDRILVSSPTYPDDEKDRYLLSNAAVQCLELLGLDSMWELWDALTEVVRRCSTHKKEMKETESSSMKDRLSFLRSHVDPIELENLSEKFAHKSQQLVKITEAVVVGSKCNIPLDLPFRISALGVLSNMLMLMNGDSSLIFTNISYFPPSDIQDKSKFLISRMLNALAFSRLEWYTNVLSKGRNRTKTHGAASESTNFCVPEARHIILKTIADMDRLISYNILDISLADIILGHYGISATQIASHEGYSISIVSPFTPIWDELALHCASKIFGNRFSSLVLALAKDQATDKSRSRATLRIKEFLSKSFDVLSSSFAISFTLYCSGVVDSDLAMIKLSRLICKSIYSWGSVAAAKPSTVDLTTLVYEALSNFVRSGLSAMIDSTKKHIDSRSGAINTLNLSGFNKGWKAWIAIINSAVQVENVFFGSANSEEAAEKDEQASAPNSHGLCM